jgi:hypothetical protein
VDANGWVQINTPPVDPSLNIAGRHGYSVWAPVGKDGLVYTPNRTTSTTQEWEMANDLGDKHASSLTQGGAIPASSTNFRTVGKIYVELGKLVTYVLYPTNSTKSLYVGLYNSSGTLLSSKVGTGTLTGYYTPNYTGWITLKVRNNVSSNPAQNCYVNVTYTAPQVVLSTNSMVATNDVSIWSGNGGNSDWRCGENWEDGVIPTAERDVIIVGTAFPQPAISGDVEVNNLIIENNAHIFLQGNLLVNSGLNNLGEITGYGSVTVNSATVNLQGMETAEFSLFPNPTNGEVNILVNGNYDASQNFQVELISPDGKLIKSINGNLLDVNTELSVALSDGASGVYFIRIVSNDAQMLKIVKE